MSDNSVSKKHSFLKLNYDQFELSKKASSLHAVVFSFVTTISQFVFAADLCFESFDCLLKAVSLPAPQWGQHTVRVLRRVARHNIRWTRKDVFVASPDQLG